MLRIVKPLVLATAVGFLGLSCCEEKPPTKKRIEAGVAQEAAPVKAPAASARVKRRGPTTLLKIIPFPREIEQEADWPWTGGTIVLPANAGEKARIAAEEINLRLKDLGADPLDVVSRGGTTRGRTIKLSLGGRGVPRKEQGYLIDSRRRKSVRLCGRDEQGLFWAAVTFRRMLRRNSEGKLVLISARIRDWPDFPMRCIARFNCVHREVSDWMLNHAFKKGPGPELEKAIASYLAGSKHAVDVIFRYKGTFIFNPTWGNPPSRHDKLVAYYKSEEMADRYLDVQRELRDYAWKRGMLFMQYLSTCIGTKPDDDDDPDVTRCVLHRSHKRYFCWSNDEANRKKAEQSAKFSARCGTRFVTIHACDGGGYENPAHWDERCRWCREKFGDDRGKADAHVYSIWYDAYKKYAPECIAAATEYPYTARIFSQPDSPHYEKTVNYWKDLHAGLPKDPNFSVCVRENTRDNILGFYNVFNTRAVFVYWMPQTVYGDHRWNPFLSGRVTQAKTFLKEGRRDWLFIPHGITPEMGLMTNAQFTWNANSRGATYYTPGLDIDRDGAEPKEFFDYWVPVFCREWFGQEAGDDMVAMYHGCISPSYALQPAVIANMCRIPNAAERMQQQYDAVLKGSEGLERIWARIERGEPDVLKLGSEPFFYKISEQAGRTRAYTSYHLARMRTEEGLRAGIGNAELAAALQKAVERVKADNAFARTMDERTKHKSKARGAHLNRWVRKDQSRLYNHPDYNGHVKALEELLSMLHGEVVEMRGPQRDLATIRWLMKDGEGLKFGSKKNTRFSLVSYPTQGGSARAIQADGLAEPWKDGLYFRFPPVDVSGYREKGGRLRFYVNGGTDGAHTFSFWLNSRGPAGVQTEEQKGWLYTSLQEWVRVDALEATWQLVDIPLDKVLKKGHTEIFGVGMNFSQYNKIAGPFWMDSMYVCLPSDPVPVKVKVQEPPAQKRATTAKIETIGGIQTEKFVGGEGTEGRVTLGLRLTGDGGLTGAKITLRFLDERGKAFFTHAVMKAAKLRTPWWSDSIRLELGRNCKQCTVEIVLQSNEVTQTFTETAVWEY